MNSYKYILTVIIPTKNRQKYAAAAVRQIYSISDHIQIVVSDNSDDNTLQNMISDIIDESRVKYIYTNHPIPVVENYSLATTLSEGKYLCAIGDDDGILPDILSLINWMIERKIDAVKPNKSLSYIWPSENEKGRLCVDSYSDKCYVMDTHKAIIDLLKNGGQGYLNLDLIGSYHCIVSMDMMNEVRELTGHYYAGASPDMYSAVCLSSLNGYKCVSVDYPFTLPGVCPKSTTYDGAKGKDAGAVKNAPHFAGNRNYIWDERVPYYYTAASIWAETMMHALADIKKNDLIDEYFDEKNLINTMYWNNESNADEILNSFNERQRTYIEKSYAYRSHKNRYIKLIRILFKVVKGKYYRKYNVDNINEAVILTMSFLNRNGKSIKNQVLSRDPETNN